jgi:hypothetical protein
MASEFTIPRTGDRPLKFTGERIAHADGERVRGKEQSRWHEIAIYHGPGGYVVQIAFRTKWQHELDHDFAAWVSLAPGEPPGKNVAALLQNYGATAYLKGFPEGEYYVERQAKLVADLTQRYNALVSEVLAGDEFAEVLE